jgi:poly-gamma-glutamate synthesis protein (capsule biosynthesis protein)
MVSARRTGALLATVICAALAGCTAAPPNGAGPPPSGHAPADRPQHPAGGASGKQVADSAGRSHSPTPSPSPTAPPTVTLAFAGDVHFAGRVAPRLRHPASALGPVAAVFRSADVAMVNLETAITTRGTPEPKSFHFRAPPSALTALRDAGVDVATLANNHAVDYGPVGLHDTLTAIRRSPLPVIGIGADEQRAYAPWIITVRGERIAFLAATQVPDRTAAAWTAGPHSPGVASALDPDRLVAAVRAARHRADAVVVYLHWGTEGVSCPTVAQRDLAHGLIAAGADAVVGTHVHLLLGGGWRGRAYVEYGLGNFLWWRDDAYSNDTGVLMLTLHGRRVVRARLVPAHIDSRGVPLVQSGAEGRRIRTEWVRLRGCTDLRSHPAR